MPCVSVSVSVNVSVNDGVSASVRVWMVLFQLADGAEYEGLHLLPLLLSGGGWRSDTVSTHPLGRQWSVRWRLSVGVKRVECEVDVVCWCEVDVVCWCEVDVVYWCEDSGV